MKALTILGNTFEIQTLTNVSVKVLVSTRSKMNTISEFRNAAEKNGTRVERVKVKGIVFLSESEYELVSNNLMEEIQGMSEFGGTFNPFYTNEEEEILFRRGTKKDWEMYHKNSSHVGIAFVNVVTKEWFVSDSQGYDYCKYVGFPVGTEFVSNVPEIDEEAEELEVSESTFRNKYCNVEFKLIQQTISGADRTDHNNEPRFYSENKRNMKKALKAMQDKFDKTTTMYQSMQIIQEAGVRCRSYCAMD